MTTATRARPGADHLPRLIGAAGDGDDLERPARRQLALEQAALDRAILIDDRRRQIVHALIDEAEQHQLHDRQRQRQPQRPRVAEDVQELLAEDRDERPPHRYAAASPRARAASSVSLTNTSSSDG